MNNNLKKLYEDLEKYKDFGANTDNCELFLDTVDKIVLKKNPNSIPILFKYLDDDSEYSWTMENIMLSLETYDTSVFIDKILEDINFYLMKSKNRLLLLLIGIVNSPSDLEILLKKIQHHSNSLLSMLTLEAIEKAKPDNYLVLQEKLKNNKDKQ